MRLTILYHSESGNTEKLADLILQGFMEVEGVEARKMRVDEIDEAFFKESAAIVFGCPTYCGSFSWPMKRWFDTTSLDVAGKLGAVFVTENHIGGGADVAELSLVGHMLARGMLAYSAGFAQGAPFTHLGAVAIRDGDEAQKTRARIFGRRVAEKAKELFGKAG